MPGYYYLIAVAAVAAVYLLSSPAALLRFAAFILRWTVIRVRVFGAENLPKSGPLILVSNHISLIDLLLIQALSPRRVRFMVRTEIIDFLPTRFIFWYLGVIKVPSPRRPKAMQAFFGEIRGRLRKGEVLCFFPEGGISGNGNLMRVRSGVEPFLPVNVGVTVLPMRFGMLHGRLFSILKGRLLFLLPQSLPVDFSSE